LNTRFVFRIWKCKQKSGFCVHYHSMIFICIKSTDWENAHIFFMQIFEYLHEKLSFEIQWADLDSNVFSKYCNLHYQNTYTIVYIGSSFVAPLSPYIDIRSLYNVIYTTCLPLWRCKIFFIVKQTIHLNKLGTSSHLDFCPFFKAKLPQLLQVGWVPLLKVDSVQQSVTVILWT
jgi:hypothetical protein